MSFLNHIGLGWLDPTNELDKLANSLKNGDVSGLIDKLKEIFGGIEESIEDVSGQLEDAVEDAKKDLRRELAQARRQGDPGSPCRPAEDAAGLRRRVDRADAVRDRGDGCGRSCAAWGRFRRYGR